MAEKSMEQELHETIRKFIEKTKEEFGTSLLDFDVAIFWYDEERNGVEIRVKEENKRKTGLDNEVS